MMKEEKEKTNKKNSHTQNNNYLLIDTISVLRNRYTASIYLLCSDLHILRHD